MQKIIQLCAICFINIFFLVGCTSESGIAGIDSNGDNVRDDVDIEIQNLYPNSKAERELARFAASVFQSALMAGASSHESVQQASKEFSRLVWCYSAFSFQDPKENWSKIKALVVDTAERAHAYGRFEVKNKGNAIHDTVLAYEDCLLAEV